MMWLLPYAGVFLLGAVVATVFHWWLMGWLADGLRQAVHHSEE